MAVHPRKLYTSVHSHTYAVCSKALVAFALQRPFCGVVRLHLFLQPAEIADKMHIRQHQGLLPPKLSSVVSGDGPSRRPDHVTSIGVACQPNVDVQGLKLLSNLDFGTAFARVFQRARSSSELPESDESNSFALSLPAVVLGAF
jgi:hypothetical protein